MWIVKKKKFKQKTRGEKYKAKKWKQTQLKELSTSNIPLVGRIEVKKLSNEKSERDNELQRKNQTVKPNYRK